MGFSLSKNPTFVDHVDIRITFGLATALGRAPSEISFDGRGGFPPASIELAKTSRLRAAVARPVMARVRDTQGNVRDRAR